MEDEGAVANNQNDLSPRERRLLRDEIRRFREHLQELELELVQELERDIAILSEAPQIGLTPERIEKFQHFDANESMVGEQCVVCLDDLIVGKRMVRLDCHVDHYLCKTCALGWFKEHNTCPTCRHEFE